jgi:hypothetical protein
LGAASLHFRPSSYRPKSKYSRLSEKLPNNASRPCLNRCRLYRCLQRQHRQRQRHSHNLFPKAIGKAPTLPVPRIPCYSGVA